MSNIASFLENSLYVFVIYASVKFIRTTLFLLILLRLYKQSLLAAHGQGQRFQNTHQKVVGEL